MHFQIDGNYFILHEKEWLDNIKNENFIYVNEMQNTTYISYNMTTTLKGSVCFILVLKSRTGLLNLSK